MAAVGRREAPDSPAGPKQTFASLEQHRGSEHEVGAEILLRIAREFGRTMEWQLTGEN